MESRVVRHESEAARSGQALKDKQMREAPRATAFDPKIIAPTRHLGPNASTWTDTLVPPVFERGPRGYFRPITMESGPTRCSVRVALNPASVIHPMQSAAV